LARRKLWLWVIPFLIAITVWEMMLAPSLGGLWVSVFSFLAEPSGYGFGATFESQAILNQLVGAWWFFGLIVFFGACSTQSGARSSCFGASCCPRWRAYSATGVG
jgi:hypothetical protein